MLIIELFILFSPFWKFLVFSSSHVSLPPPLGINLNLIMSLICKFLHDIIVRTLILSQILRLFVLICFVSIGLDISDHILRGCIFSKIRRCFFKLKFTFITIRIQIMAGDWDRVESTNAIYMHPSKSAGVMPASCLLMDRDIDRREEKYSKLCL